MYQYQNTKKSKSKLALSSCAHFLSPNLTVPLQGRNVRHEPMAEPYGLRRLEVGEPAKCRPVRVRDDNERGRQARR